MTQHRFSTALNIDSQLCLPRHNATPMEANDRHHLLEGHIYPVVRRQLYPERRERAGDSVS